MVTFILLVLISVTLGAFGQIYIKKGLNELGGFTLNDILSKKIIYTFLNPSVFFGLLLYVIATVAWFVVLSMSDVSFVYPFVAIGYIITAILARFYFNENITITRWFAILIIVGGVFLLMRS